MVYTLFLIFSPTQAFLLLFLSRPFHISSLRYLLFSLLTCLFSSPSSLFVGKGHVRLIAAQTKGTLAQYQGGTKHSARRKEEENVDRVPQKM